MDFIERWLGISPDGGSGAFELMILVLLAAALVAMTRYRTARQRRRR
jgi:hypothetical protein